MSNMRVCGDSLHHYTSDLKLLGVTGAPLNLVDLSEKGVKFVPTLEDVESMNTLVHVLVVVPPPDETTSPYVYNGFENSKAEKAILVKKYKCDCGRNKNDDAMLLCMVMNVALPSTVVIASHIFRREHDHLKEHFVQIADIDDVRNCSNRSKAPSMISTFRFLSTSTIGSL
ncbi:hypothetical protein PPTG_23473 [Phytophthora nicotianae INRA-310]|uniref:Uncharacterized protein n=1 Tax=Phytophthora nicotianae (strain INRA-310) TaxID=761204 RepID=W2PXB7_PHYN3|nr:hypothetical protein PPTG_23473 [Phytophthora nicotianae INRA-310]ETN05542.1 hypothetical protein PPTG_23473 [Phytophthora nicotianae INRA-310]